VRNLLDRRSRPGSSDKESRRFRATAGQEIALVLFAAPCARPQPRRVGAEASESGWRTAITGKDNFNRKVRSSMRQPQNNPKKSAPSIGTPLSNTLHEREATYA
jgi:hypothetical protein